MNPMANFRSSPHTAGPRAASATSCSWRGGVWAGFVPFCNRDLQRRGRGAGARGVPEVTERAAHRERGQGWGWGRRPRAERLQGKAQKAAAPQGTRRSSRQHHNFPRLPRALFPAPGSRGGGCGRFSSWLIPGFPRPSGETPRALFQLHP